MRVMSTRSRTCRSHSKAPTVATSAGNDGTLCRCPTNSRCSLGKATDLREVVPTLRR
jgi:hypothetical protein